jgi:predicted glycosyltransferase
MPPLLKTTAIGTELNCDPDQAYSLTATGLVSTRIKTIWIDLDNSPHVPLFAPIIKELRRRGHSVLVTARDCFQVCELARLLGVEYKLIGRHYGENKILKMVGLCIRALELGPTVLRGRPDLALSHGSRAQLLLCAALKVPSIVMIDYEFAAGLTLMRPTWIMVPEAIPDTAIHFDHTRILKYPGIKEDVYVPRFAPDPNIRTDLGLDEDDLVVTLRPPANEAHYHNPESDLLFHAVIDLLRDRSKTKMVLLPRNERQEISIRNSWPDLFASGKIIVPADAVDGLNLIWFSDLVISGGGTMNREAAALGVPVYSIFRGKIGAVDRHLANAGRLVLVESIEDVKTKIVLRRRHRTDEHECASSRALTNIVKNVEAIISTQFNSEKRNVYES